MWRYTLRRLAQIIPLVLLISVLCFALMHAIPGGPAGMLANNPKVSPEDAARVRAYLDAIDPAKWRPRADQPTGR